MRKILVVAGVALATMLASCGGGKSKSASSEPTSANPVATTSSASPSTSVSVDPARAAFGRLQDFVGSTKGLDGSIDYVENDGTAGALHLAGKFGFDANLAAPAGDLQLQAMLTSPVPIGIRFIGNQVYFRQGTQGWSMLRYDPTMTPAESSDLQLAAMLLSDITPSTWSALANGDLGLKATPAARGATTLTGALSTFGAARELDPYPGASSLHAIKQWPNDVTYSITTDQQGQIFAATEKWTGTSTSATVTIKVDGYAAPAVTTPTINVAN